MDAITPAVTSTQDIAAVSPQNARLMIRRGD